MDFGETFDKVLHRRIIKKVAAHGIGEKIYLLDRGMADR